MHLSWDEIQANAVAFSKRWADAACEKQQDQGFIEALLRVFGVEDSRTVGTFQEKTKIEGHTKWIDYPWPYILVPCIMPSSSSGVTTGMTVEAKSATLWVTM